MSDLKLADKDGFSSKFTTTAGFLDLGGSGSAGPGGVLSEILNCLKCNNLIIIIKRLKECL